MKVSIVGMGRVGSAIAFSIVLRRLADELVLVGKPAERAAGEAADLQHASAMGRPMVVRAGELPSVAGSDVIVLAASSGVPTIPDGGGAQADRMAEARGNAALFAQLVPELVRLCPGGVFLVVSNPVDVMTGLTLRLTGGVVPPGRVFGSGTLIDTARYRSLLAARLGMHTNDLRAYMLGEHGERQFPAVSCATAGGARLAATPDGLAMCRELGELARGEGHRVFKAKGYTNYAIAAAVAMLLEAILEDHHSVFPVSTLLTDYCGVSGVCLSVPAVIGRAGVLRVIDLDLSSEERAALHAGAEVVRAAMNQAP